jgi:hypothetical protein
MIIYVLLKKMQFYVGLEYIMMLFDNKATCIIHASMQVAKAFFLIHFLDSRSLNKVISIYFKILAWLALIPQN